jgi:predicted metalloprotease with PDZ domain
VLGARATFKSKEQYLNTIATTAASLDYKAGRDWRSTEDTAIAASILRGGAPEWSNWKRGQDYYQVGTLLWMDIDTKIRQLTDDKKSLTDFQKIFLGKGGNTGPLIVGYERKELVDDLNAVAPYDWAKLLHDKVDTPTVHADMDGITQGGYKLVYLDHPPAGGAGGRGAGPGSGDWYSIGLRIAGGGGFGPRGGGGAEGTISDVRYGGPGDDAKLYPGQRILSVNGQVYSAEVMSAAIKAAKGTTEPIHLLLEHEGAVTTAELNYHEGEKYPALERVEGTPDLLMEIAKPLTTIEHAPGYEAGAAAARWGWAVNRW